MSTSFFSVIMLAMALYVLVGGITGKGKLFEVEGVPEEKRPKFKKTLRILYLVMGLFMILNTGISYLRDQMYTYEKVYTEETAAETVAEATAETATEPAAEATTEPAAEATAEPAAEATAEPAAEATTEPAAEATAEPAAEATPAPAEATATTEAAATEATAEVTATPEATAEPAYTYVMSRSDKYPQIDIPYNVLNVLAFVMLGITMAAIVAMFVVINKFVDKEAARKAQEEKSKKSGGRRGNGEGPMPASAFEFDDEPEEKKEEK